MKNFIKISLFALLFAACQNDDASTTATQPSAKNGLTLLTEANPEWQYENLRIYPVIADASAANNTVKDLKTLSEAMKTPGFRVLERKQFGRGDEAWYHGLTVQNKTQDTVLLMSGDVVTCMMVSMQSRGSPKSSGLKFDFCQSTRTPAGSGPVPTCTEASCIGI